MEIEGKIKLYKYGMRLRGFAPGCQPMDGLAGKMKESGKYHDILLYYRELTGKEIRDYELDRLEESGE